MRIPSRSTVIVILLACILAVLAWRAFAPQDPVSKAASLNTGDLRERVSLDHEKTNFALTQMRGLLASLARLDEAEFEEDLETARTLAVEQGPGQMRPHPDGFHEALPDTFRAMSRQMRQGFGQIAEAAERRDWEAYAKAKAEVQNTCLTCHESYRFEVRE